MVQVVRTDLGRLRAVRRLLDQYEALWRGRIDRMTGLLAGPGTQEGRRQAVGQIDAILAQDPAGGGRGRPRPAATAARSGTIRTMTRPTRKEPRP